MATKYQMVADVLRSEISAGAYPEMMLPTEQVLCQRFQVSRQTVRQALSVLVREGLIIRRQGSGSRICEAADPTHMPHRSIAVVTTYISDYIFPSILREVETVLSNHNSAPLLFATQNQVANERKILQTLLAMPQLDGLLIEGTKTGLPNPNMDLYNRLNERHIPLVFMNGNYPQLTENLSVLDDNYNGGRMLVDYLYGKGHREIAGIFKNDDIQGPQRYAGYVDALRDLGLPMDDRRIYWYNTESKSRLLSDNMLDLLGPYLAGCSAVVCYNDEVASRLVSESIRRGRRIPGDLAVVSFDNSQYSELSLPRITSLSHGEYNVGRMAAELLFRVLQGESCTSEYAPWTLMEKESS